jgi:glycosyltransferase involved in cell wall biosynthesis
MTRRPRLLVLASTYPARPGDGVPAFVRDLAVQESRDFDVLVLTPRVAGAPLREQDGPLSVRRYPYFPRRWEDLADGAIIENLRAAPRRWLQVVPFLVAQYIALRSTYREFHPDLIHVHWIIPQGIVAHVALRGVPRIVTTLGGDLYALNNPLLRAAKRWVLRHADRVTVMNRDMLDAVLRLGVNPAHAQVIPMGVDVAAVLPAAANAPIAAGRRVQALFVGRLVEKKGLAVLLEALRRIDAATHPITLTVVGDGPLRGVLEAAAGDLDLDARFVGQLGREALAGEYARADLVVVPSVPATSGDQDGLPVAMLEAMASGRPVIASDLPGLNEVIADERNGLLVPAGDAASLATALTRLAEDAELRAVLGDAARLRAHEFSVERVGERYRILLSDLAAGAETR